MTDYLIFLIKVIGISARTELFSLIILNTGRGRSDNDPEIFDCFLAILPEFRRILAQHGDEEKG